MAYSLRFSIRFISRESMGRAHMMKPFVKRLLKQ